MVFKSCKTEQKGVGQQGRAATGLLTKKFLNDIKISFCNIMSEVRKDSEDVSTGIGNFNKSDV